MIAKKILITAAILIGATSMALAQSEYTTGTASDMARAGYPTAYGSSGYGAYAYVGPHHSIVRQDHARQRAVR